MARLGCAIACRDCKKPLNFQENINAIDFILTLLTFYQDHNKCEEIAVLKEKHEEELAKIKAPAPVEPEEPLETDTAFLKRMNETKHADQPT